uniref:Uncharacterized protein n=1 Tax=Oryza barthii TaxID=65489 RepID=A0A0D3GZA3_9ORYZ
MEQVYHQITSRNVGWWYFATAKFDIRRLLVSLKAKIICLCCSECGHSPIQRRMTIGLVSTS